METSQSVRDFWARGHLGAGHLGAGLIKNQHRASGSGINEKS